MIIQYEPRPRRLYRIGWEQALVEERPSVTEILRCLDKPALTVWGMRVGIAANLEMFLRAGITPEQLLAGKPADMEMVEWARKISQEQWFKDMGISTNDVRDRASTRGLTVHNAFSYWASTGLMPYPGEFPEHEQGYVLALIAFLKDVPSLKPVGIELAVGSVEHGFAGRYDLRGETSKEHRVVVKTYPKAPSKTTKLPAGSFLFDLKTSVDIFPEHSLQLAAYEMASVESGYEPTDHQAVVQLGEDGRYQCRRSAARPEDFLAVKGCFHALKRTNEGMKVEYRPKAAA